jgi:transposase InsO family protein
LGIPRSGIYNHSNPDKKLQEQEELKEQILSILNLNPSYGHRRIALALGISRKRVRRIMKLYGIRPYKRKARWRKRRDLRRPAAPYENLIKGICPIVPGTVLVGDFTHLVYFQKVVYLATYLDLVTREVVGWFVSGRHTKEIVLEAMVDAVKTLGQLPMVVHTDQGSEYTSKEYIGFLESLGIQISMSKKASPWENGYQESFYNNFKTDLGLEFDRFNTLGEFIAAIHLTINYYNTTRIHTRLKMSPAEYRRKLMSKITYPRRRMIV